MKKIVFSLAFTLLLACTQVQAQTTTADDLLAQINALQAQLIAMQNGAGTPIATAGGGTTVDNGVNPLNVARAFAMRTPDSYQCYLSGSMLVGDSFEWMSMSFTMRKDFAITRLDVNGTPVSLPEPIHGLPMGDGGVIRNVYLNVGALTATGEYAGNGYLQRDVVTKGDSLVVVLMPAQIKQEIPVDISASGGDVQFSVDNFTYGYGWGVENGKLYAYLPPIGGKYHYTVRDMSSGVVIGSGWLEPFKPAVTPNDAYVGVTMIGNVVGAEFVRPDGLDDWDSVSDFNFDCSVPTTAGTNVIGKVIFVDVGTGGLDLGMNGDVTIFVQSVTSDGDMPFLVLEDHSVSSPGWKYTWVNTIAKNVGKVVITIIPNPGNTSGHRWLNLHRFYISPDGDGRG